MFEIEDDKYSDPDIDLEFEGWLDDSKFKIRKIVTQHAQFKFIYDFGDWWFQTVTFEKFVDFDRVFDADTFRLELTNLRIGRRQKPRSNLKLIESAVDLKDKASNW